MSPRTYPSPLPESPVTPTPDEWTVRFAFNSAEIADQYRDNLRQMAQLLKGSSGTLAVIEGHTDSTGETPYNMQLSQRRVKGAARTDVS